MKEEIKFWIILIAILVLSALVWDKKEVEVVTAQCPALAPVIKKVQIDSDWQCNEPEQYMDLLQPSGVWINKSFDCWKLQQPIEEYCKTNPCASNNYLKLKVIE